MATERDEIALDRLLQAGRAGPVPSDDLLARIMADAMREAAAPPVPAPAARRGPLAALLAMIGGWPAAAGMVTAAGASVWLGFYSPELVDSYVGSDSVSLGDFLPDAGVLAAEGS